MKDKLKGLIKIAGNRELTLLITLTFAFFALMESLGLFRLEPATIREIFHSTPVKVVSLLLIMNAVLGLFTVILKNRGYIRIGSFLFYLALMIIIAGLWISVYTRFEGNFARAEKQSFGAFRDDYIEETLYMAEDRRLPQIGMTFHSIEPEVSEDMQRILKVSADITYAGRTTNKLIDTTISSDEFFVYDWTNVSFVDFGYAIKFILYDLSEKELEKNNHYMKLFPAGSEERTEAMFLGYSFYIKAFPDYIDNNGTPATKSPYPNNPVFNLRIVRNKDIVFNGLVKPEEKVKFDMSIVAIPEMKMFVEMRLVRDLGVPVAIAGIPVMILGMVLIMIGRKKVKYDGC